jgi:hypothetical protein
MGVAALVSADARADVLNTPDSLEAREVVKVEELSYEVIVDVDGPKPKARVRVALLNSGSVAQDAHAVLAFPRGATLEGLRINRGQGWIDAGATGDRGLRGERDDGSVYARQLPSGHERGLPAGEVVLYGMAPHATVQLELVLDVVPTLRAGRWELDLPRRHAAGPNLMGDRRVVVRGLPRGESFYVDGRSSGDQKVMITRVVDTVTVGWQAQPSSGSGLQGSYELFETRDATSGRFRMMLRLAGDKAARPDHVVMMVDRSRSSSRSLQRSAGRVLAELLDALPRSTTFDVVGFDREAVLLAEGRADADDARGAMLKALDSSVRHSGTDLRPAMRLVGERIGARGAKRPLVMIVSDGMLPAVPADEISDAFQAGAASASPGFTRSPEVLFVVDDPLFSVGKLSTSSTIASLASHLGARIAVRSLVNLRGQSVDSLLASPRVLGDLSVRLPPGMRLDRPVDGGLIAGQRLVLEGSYDGRAASSVSVTGTLGRRTVSRRLTASRRAAKPDAFALAPEGGEASDAEALGFALPTWLTHRLARESRAGVDAVSGDGRLRRGELDADIIRRYIGTRVMPRTTACYNASLTRHRGQAGRFVFSFELGKGEVMLARVTDETLTHADPLLTRCMEEAAWKLEVPAGHLDGQVYLVRYPVKLTPPHGDAEATTTAAPIDDTLYEIMMRRAEILSR